MVKQTTKKGGITMYNADDFDGDYEMAIQVSREIADRTKGEADCYCSNNTVCRPCSRNY